MPQYDISPPPMTVRRRYLVTEEALTILDSPEMQSHCVSGGVQDGSGGSQWTESFYDTTSSSLSNSECILKTDSSAPKYWKFFCFAKDNIMEITTDEQEIRDPLSRMLNFSSPDLITKDLLQPFFHIQNATKVYLVDGCEVSVTQTDFGWGHCVIQRFAMDDSRVGAVVQAIQAVADKLKMKNLVYYEPVDYLAVDGKDGKKIKINGFRKKV